MIEANKVLVAVTSAVVTAIAMWIFGWVRVFLANRLRVSSPIDRKLENLEILTRNQSLMLDAVVDRQTNHAKALIALANAVKSGDQEMVSDVLDLMTRAEDTYVEFLRSQTTRRTNQSAKGGA